MPIPSDLERLAVAFAPTWLATQPEKESRIERLVIALIGSPNVEPFEHPMGLPYFATRVVMLAAHINEELKKAETQTGPVLETKPFVSDKVEWPTDE